VRGIAIRGYKRAFLLLLILCTSVGCSSIGMPRTGFGAATWGGTDGASRDLSYRIVHNFGRGTDGVSPTGAMVVVSSKLYGSARFGGIGDNGVIFSIAASGAEKIVHYFRELSKGAQPAGDLLSISGTLYGVTSAGGAHGYGTVFSMTTAGKERILHSFNGGKDGAQPMAGLTLLDGKLYGTTELGGRYGHGTVFSITTSGDEHVIHSFGLGSDGIDPEGGLVPVNGTLFGTTSGGGGPSGSGFGTIFSIAASGLEKVPVSFNCGNGAHPVASMTLVAGSLYGTTSAGGNGCGSGAGNGIVFALSDGQTERRVYAFGGPPDGTNPSTALTRIHQGAALCGATAYGGSFKGGTIFTVTPGGKESVIHEFGYGLDGNTPLGGLTRRNGTLFGTASNGGKYGGGVTYALNL
jgi:uncharacterized repeat protein (TIGR03803 family)